MNKNFVTHRINILLDTWPAYLLKYYNKLWCKKPFKEHCIKSETNAISATKQEIFMMLPSLRMK